VTGDAVPLACVDCLGPAIVQVLSPEGFPVATYCGECWQAEQEFGAAIAAMLDRAVTALAELP
jgi:hypothetical protein